MKKKIGLKLKIIGNSEYEIWNEICLPRAVYKWV